MIVADLGAVTTSGFAVETVEQRALLNRADNRLNFDAHSSHRGTARPEAG